MLRAACAFALLLGSHSDQTYYVQVEILPPDAPGADSAADVADRLVDAVTDTGSSLHSSGFLAFDAAEQVRVETSAMRPAVDVESDGDVHVAAVDNVDIAAENSAPSTMPSKPTGIFSTMNVANTRSLLANGSGGGFWM